MTHENSALQVQISEKEYEQSHVAERFELNGTAHEVQL
jgi:hypothetical protein